MPDSQINEALTSSKLEYESAIGLSQHVPQAKTISEMVLDAFQTAKESEEIRELRAAIRLAQDEHDDDKAYELMGQLKRLKDAEAADSAALADLGAQFPISRILSSYKDDPAFQELVYSLALKVLNQTHQAISNPYPAKSKTRAPRRKPRSTPSARMARVSACRCAPRVPTSMSTAKPLNSSVSPLSVKAMQPNCKKPASSTMKAANCR